MTMKYSPSCSPMSSTGTMLPCLSETTMCASSMKRRTKSSSAARWGSTRLTATGFSKPAAPRTVPRYTSPIPPEASFRTNS